MGVRGREGKVKRTKMQYVPICMQLRMTNAHVHYAPQT